MKVNKQKRGIKTKQKISSIAVSLFSKHGYDNVSVDEIVKESDTSKGSFYSHFRSKADILFEEFAKADTYYLKIYHSLPSHLSTEEKILTFVIKMMRYIESLDKDMIKVIYSSAITHNPDFFVKEDRKLYFIIHSLVSEGIKNKEFCNKIELHDTTKYISRGLRGSLYDWCLNDNHFNLVEETKGVISTLINGLKAI